MGEDERDNTKIDVQDLTKKYEGKVNSIADAKEKDVMDD